MQWWVQEVVTLQTDAVKDATASILELHSIPAAVSKDLLALLLEVQHVVPPAAATAHAANSWRTHAADSRSRPHVKQLRH